MTREVMQQAFDLIERLNKHGWILADFETEVYATLDSLKAALEQPPLPVQEPVAWVTVEGGVWVSTRSADFRHIADGQYQLYAGPLQNDVFAAISTLKAIGYVYDNGKFCKEGEQWIAPTASQPPLPVQPEPLEYWNAVEGWVKIDEVREHFDAVNCGTIYKHGGEGRVPLYTAPPQREWVGLTEFQFAEIYNKWNDSNGSTAWGLYHSIEKALKAKNHG